MWLFVALFIFLGVKLPKPIYNVVVYDNEVILQSGTITVGTYAPPNGEKRHENMSALEIARHMANQYGFTIGKVVKK